jgi:hypothetical protein
MRGVRVDPVTRTVRVAGYVTGDHATHAFGLAATFNARAERANVC